MEIGSIYEMNPNCIEQTGFCGETTFGLKEVEKHGRENTVYTASAREAISLVLYSLEKECPDCKKKCLMPAYMCDTVFIPFVRNGWELFFYHIGKDMKVDRTELEELIRRENPDLLFIHDYYGVDTWAEFRTLFDEWKKNGMRIMEDVTQAYYLNVGNTADYVIGSLRKWYAIADGGFATTNHVLFDEIVIKDDTFALERFKVLSKKWDYLQKIQQKESELTKEQTEELKQQKEEFLSGNRELEERLDNYENVTAISDISKGVLVLKDEEDAKACRRSNYRILAEGLKDKKCVLPVIKDPKEEAVPLYFPVYMEDRDKLQEYLRNQDIYVPVLWPVAKENEPVLSKEEQYIFSHIAAIPMDQRYGKEDMERIVEAINRFEENCK